LISYITIAEYLRGVLLCFDVQKLELSAEFQKKYPQYSLYLYGEGFVIIIYITLLVYFLFSVHILCTVHTSRMQLYSHGRGILVACAVRRPMAICHRQNIA